MKILVTGGNGFIGSHLVDRLISEGATVFSIDNLSTGRKENLAHLEGNKDLHCIYRDLNDPACFQGIPTDFDFIYHTAALADIVPSVQNPVEYFNANVQGTLMLLEFAKKCTNLSKFVYSASSSCYGLPNHFPTDENQKINTQYPYALTKYMGEELSLHWGKLYKIPVVSTRYFNVYGPRSRTSGTYGAVFGVFLAQKLAKKPFTVVGDGTQKRDFIFVTDLIDAVVKLASSPFVGEIFNIGTGNPQSILRLVELLGGEVTFVPKRPGEPDMTWADPSKLKRHVSWEPKVSFERGVEIMLENIQYWKKAPVWTPDSIKTATSTWFEAFQS